MWGRRTSRGHRYVPVLCEASATAHAAAQGAGTAMVFINGALVAKEEALRVIQARHAPCDCYAVASTMSWQVSRGLNIGQYADGQYGFGGRIAHIVVFNCVITPAQLQHGMSVRMIASR